MEVVGSAGTGEEAVAVFRRERPDITLMDLQLPTMTGLEAIVAIRQESPEARVIVLTMYEGDEDIHRALTAGAATYLLKDTISDDLIRFVREVHAGRRPIRPDVKARLDERASEPTLTPREMQVMELVAEGRRNKEIASSARNQRGDRSGAPQEHLLQVESRRADDCAEHRPPPRHRSYQVSSAAG